MLHICEYLIISGEHICSSKDFGTVNVSKHSVHCLLLGLTQYVGLVGWCDGAG